VWKRHHAVGSEEATNDGLTERENGAAGKKSQQQTNYEASTESFHQIRVGIHTFQTSERVDSRVHSRWRPAAAETCSVLSARLTGKKIIT
jgi:peptidyl-tRNA hydrolase